MSGRDALTRANAKYTPLTRTRIQLEGLVPARVCWPQRGPTADVKDPSEILAAVRAGPERID